MASRLPVAPRLSIFRLGNIDSACRDLTMEFLRDRFAKGLARVIFNALVTACTFAVFATLDVFGDFPDFVEGAACTTENAHNM